MVLYDLKIKMPNKGYIEYTDLLMDDLINTIKEELKKQYDITDIIINKYTVYNLHKRRDQLSSLLREFVFVVKK